MQWGFLPRQFLQASKFNHFVDRGVMGSKPTLCFQNEAFPVVLVTEAALDQINESFSAKRRIHAMMDTTPRPICLVEKKLYFCVFQMLLDVPSPPRIEVCHVEIIEKV